MRLFLSLLTSFSFSFFFFNDTATTEIYTLSLHDALPISDRAAHLSLLEIGDLVWLRASILPPHRPPLRWRRLLALPEAQQGTQGFGGILGGRLSELVVAVDAVAGAADAYFTRLQDQPVALADDRRACCVGGLPPQGATGGDPGGE